MKVPVCIRDNYIIFLEWFDGWLWFHTDVKQWSKSIKKNFIEDTNKIQSLLPLPLVALVKEEDKKLAKFGESLGWEKHKTISLENNLKAHIYNWRK